MEGVVQKLVGPADEVQLREFTAAESDLEEAVKLMLSKYSRVFKVLFSKYSGTGFARKAHHKSDFDSHAERKSKLTDGEYIRIMKDHNVIPGMLTKEELRTIMRSYNHRIIKQADQGFVDYEGFKGAFCQIAYHIYSKKNQDYNHLPPVVSVKLLLDYMRNYLKSKNISTEVFDEPDPGKGDKDVVKSLNKLLLKDPNTPMPEGYKRITDKDLRIFYTVPDCLGMPASYKNSIEILDSILSNIGIRIIEPQVEYITNYRAKGIAPVKREKSVNQPLYDRSENPSKEKIKSALSMISSNSAKLSPALKFCIAHAPSDEKETYEECASLLEDILHSIQLKMKRVINRQPKVGAQEEKFEQKKEKEKKDEELKKAEEDRKRKLRQQQLLDELNKAKDERQKRIKIEEDKRRYESIIEEQRKKELEEKNQREKEEKQRMLQEWLRRKEEEKDSKKEEETKKKNNVEELKRLEEAKKRNQERLEQMIKEKQQKNNETKIEENKRSQQEKEAKERKKLLGIKQLKESRIKEGGSQASKKREDVAFLSNPEVKAILNTYSPQIDCAFTFYLSQMGKEMPPDASISWIMFDKFLNQFTIYSMISQEQSLSIFKFLTKKKTIETLSFEEFKNSLVMIANKCKDSLGVEEGGKALEAMLNKIELTIPVKNLKIKLKTLQESNSNKKDERKKRGSAVSQEKLKKGSVDIDQSEKINFEPLQDEPEFNPFDMPDDENADADYNGDMFGDDS